MSQHPEEHVRKHAHQLWEKAGCPEGKSEEFWKQAEIELDAEADLCDQPNAKTVPG